MNFLHSRYQKAGKISNDDMLYTLSLFILEVESWIKMYEWRELTEMEACALYDMFLVSILFFFFYFFAFLSPPSLIHLLCGKRE